MRAARGSITVLILGLVAATGVVAAGVGRFGIVAVAARRAALAADAASLAGADELALGGDCASAQVQAARFARANGALLIDLDCDGNSVEVSVQVRDVVRRARAEVDDCWWCMSAS